MVLAHRASYAKKTLARQVIPLALGYWTALSSRPGFFHISLVTIFVFTLAKHFNYLTLG